MWLLSLTMWMTARARWKGLHCRKGEDSGVTDAETAGMPECHEESGTTEQGRGRTDSCLKLPEGISLGRTSMFVIPNSCWLSGLQNYKEINSYHFKTQHLWKFMTAAQKNIKSIKVCRTLFGTLSLKKCLCRLVSYSVILKNRRKKGTQCFTLLWLHWTHKHNRPWVTHGRHLLLLFVAFSNCYCIISLIACPIIIQISSEICSCSESPFLCYHFCV